MKSVNQLALGWGDDPAFSGGPNNHQGLYKPRTEGGKNQTEEAGKGHVSENPQAASRNWGGAGFYRSHPRAAGRSAALISPRL